MRTDNENKPTNFIVIALVAVFCIIVIRRAWVAEDAYITFRTIDNWLHGFGLTWNVDERVQAFTHPLWLLLFTPFYAVAREPFFSNILFSLAISTSAVSLYAWKLAQTKTAAILGILALTCSNAFVDYSTSGLENPLTHLLLVLFYLVFLNLAQSTKKIFVLTLLTALIGLNRSDAILLCLPAWISMLLHIRSSRELRYVLFGLLPLVLWELFSLYYYGFLFPNTAYAKLNTGIDDHYLIQQGFAYLLNSLTNDPITLVTIALGVIAGFLWRERKSLVIVLGILFYVIYVVKIGGDFMSGRFLAAPLLCAVILLSQVDFSGTDGRWFYLAPLFILIFGFSSPFPTFNSVDERTPGELIDERGIADERQFYLAISSLATYARGKEYPGGTLCLEGQDLKQKGKKVTIENMIGIKGFCAGPTVHILDKYALAEPLLARLPVDSTWRIGHFPRTIPEGYVATLETGINTIRDNYLATYYDKLSILTRGELWDFNRLMEIWKMNTGQYDGLIRQSIDAKKEKKLEDLSEVWSEGTAWNAPGVTIMQNNGILINLEQVSHAGHISISLDHNDSYQLQFILNQKVVGTLLIPVRLVEPGGLRVEEISLPENVMAAGYDHVRVIPESGWFI